MNDAVVSACNMNKKREGTLFLSHAVTHTCPNARLKYVSQHFGKSEHLDDQDDSSFQLLTHYQLF